jgi:hypothetical protein
MFENDDDILHIDFFEKDDIYIITQIIENRNNNILGISFADEKSERNTIEVHERNLRQYHNSPIQTSREEILDQVLWGIEIVNQFLGTDYNISKIYYILGQDDSEKIYKNLIIMLVLHYHGGNKFKEITDFDDLY